MRDPVLPKIRFQHHHMEMLEAHGFQCLKGRTNIGTFIDGTAAAVDVNVRALREPACRLPQRLQSCGRRRWSGIDCAWNVLAAVENVKADLQDDRFRDGVAGKHGSQLAGLGDLRRRPGVRSGILCMSGRLRKREYANERERECNDVKLEQAPPVRIHIVSVLRANPAASLLPATTPSRI